MPGEEKKTTKEGWATKALTVSKAILDSAMAGLGKVFKWVSIPTAVALVWISAEDLWHQVGMAQWWAEQEAHNGVHPGAIAEKSAAQIKHILEGNGFPVTDTLKLTPEHWEQLRELFARPGLPPEELERMIQEIVRAGGYTDNAGHHFKVFASPLPQTFWDKMWKWHDSIEQVEVTEPVPGAPRMVQEGTTVRWETGGSEPAHHESAAHAGVPTEPQHHGSAAQVEVPYEFSPQERDAFLVDDARLGGKSLSFYNQENPFNPGEPEYEPFNRCRAFLEKLPEDIWRTSNMPASNMF